MGRGQGPEPLEMEAAISLRVSVAGSPAADQGGANALTGRRLWCTAGLIYAAVVIDQGDVALLPSMFRALEVSLGARPTALGAADFLTSICAATFAPLWGSLADRFSRMRLLVCVSLLWGVCSAGMACSKAWGVFLLLRTLNGVSLGGLYPLKWSLLSDCFGASDRGLAFGGVGIASAVGRICASSLATSVSEEEVFDVEGWRVAFLVVSALCAVFAIFVCVLGTEPARGAVDGVTHTKSQWGTLWAATKSVICQRTFVLLTASECFGSVATHSLHWLTLWLQYAGYTDSNAAVLVNVHRVGGLLGSLGGSFAADLCARKSPEHGRIWLGQAGQLLGMLLALAVFRMTPGSPWLLALLLFGLGFCHEWIGFGVNKPLLMEIATVRTRGIVAGYEHIVVKGFGALGGPLVGWLAEHEFGYIGGRKKVSEMSEQARASNVASLQAAILGTTLVPWAISLAILCLLHLAYPRDRATAREQQRDKDSEEALGSSFLANGGSPCSTPEGREGG